MNRNKVFALVFSFFFSWILLSGGADAESVPYYSIHGASYQNIEPTEQHIRSLQEKGYEAFYERVDIPGKGEWYRIIIGRYNKKVVAQQAAEDLKAHKLIPWFRIRRNMLPAVMDARSPNKKVKFPERLDDTSLPAIDPFPMPKKPTKAKAEKIAPRPDTQRSAAAQRKGEGIAGQGRQPASPPAISAPPATVQTHSGAASIPAPSATVQTKSVPPAIPAAPATVQTKSGPPAIPATPATVQTKNLPPAIPAAPATVQTKSVPPAIPTTPATVQTKNDPPAGQESGSLLDGARREFKAQNYDRTLTLLQSILSQPTLPEAVRGQALRLAADCHYFMGLKGNSQFFLTAVEQYKIILARYPDPAAGNDQVYYYLAKSNEFLSFFYESAGAWDRLISTYPDSELLPEAMFKLGSLLNQTGKYNQAVDRLLAYLKKNPAGEYAKVANFMLGDCYYLLHKVEFAGQQYDEARKKWPNFHDIPVKTIINMGNHYFTARKFSSSLQVFSLYHNLFPAGEFSKSSLHLMARNAEAMGETAMALRLYSLFIDKYPQDSEAETCLMAMAALGVVKPGIKYPYYVLPVDAYQSPLKVFDSLLAKNPGGEKEAALLLLKGDALVNQNRIKEGFASFITLLSRFPRGKSSEEGRNRLTVQVRSLVNDSYEKGDYLAVADIYFQGQGTELVPLNDFATAIRMGNSLLLTGLQDEALKIYGALKKIYPDRERQKVIILALAKIDMAKNRDETAEEKLLFLLSEGGEKNQELRNDIKITLADLYYKKALWAKANPLYADVLLARGQEQGPVYRNYGRSLQAAKLPEKAIVNYLRALKDYELHPTSYQADILVDIYGSLGDAYYDVKSYQEGIEAYRQALAHAGKGNVDVGKWLTYMIGKGSANLKDFTGAEKSFAQVKANAVGDFWPKVTDYVLDGSRIPVNAGY